MSWSTRPFAIRTSTHSLTPRAQTTVGMDGASNRVPNDTPQGEADGCGAGNVGDVRATVGTCGTWRIGGTCAVLDDAPSGTAYQELAKRHPSFRTRSETTELIVEITLQPWKAFKPDGVILFSDILTILPAMGVPFEIDDQRGPIIETPVRTSEQVAKMTPLNLEMLSFVGESLGLVREELRREAALLGFVGAPWTIATYLVEGQSSSIYKTIKTMIGRDPETLDHLLSFLAEQIAQYMIYQIESGAQVVQIFDSWGGQLPPKTWDRWSKPYIAQIIQSVHSQYPDVPITLYANGGAGLLERMRETGADVIGLDWMVDMSDARTRLGAATPVQGNVDPCVLFGEQSGIQQEVLECIRAAGPRGHILNLGHGVIVGTPEENVAYMFDLSKKLLYRDVFGTT